MLVRRAIHRIEGIDHVDMHPAQLAMWKQAATLVESLEDVPTLENFHWTMAGFPIHERPEMPKTIVTFCDKKGRELAVITNLAIPVGA